jgi:hypothetical protein
MCVHACPCIFKDIHVCTCMSDRMHSTARCCGYPLDSTRAERMLARGAVSKRLVAGSPYRRCRPTTSPPPPGPAAFSAGPGAARPGQCAGAGWSPPPSPPPAAAEAGAGATRPGLCAWCGSDPATVTAPGRRCWPGPVPPARTSLSRVAGWVLTADRTALSGRRAVRHRLLSGRQLGCSLVCWFAGAHCLCGT